MKRIFVFCDGTGNDGNLVIQEPHLDVASQEELKGKIDFASKGEFNPISAEELILGSQNWQSAEQDVLYRPHGLDDSPAPKGEVAVFPLLKQAAESLGSDTPILGSSSTVHYPTNVLRLSRAVLPQSNDQKIQQLVLYMSGVGTEADYSGEGVRGTDLLMALGTSVASKIRDAYAFIAQNYEVGDEILLFGFSRGAYAVRKLSGLIDKIGLLQRHDLGYFFRIWFQLTRNEQPTIPSGTRRTRIRCVGVWDTVGSVFRAIDALSIKDDSLPESVDVALHAVSFHEDRKTFLPTLWETPSGGLRQGQVLKQVWFPGAHSDVGGGYQRSELADLALFWMAGEIQVVYKLADLDMPFIQKSGQINPEPWGKSKPHDAYGELPIYKRAVFGYSTRLESKDITKSSKIHFSLDSSPTDLASDLLTLPQVEKKLGVKYQFEELNSFEDQCMTNWGIDTVPGPIRRPVFERPGQLFEPQPEDIE